MSIRSILQWKSLCNFRSNLTTGHGIKQISGGGLKIVGLGSVSSEGWPRHKQ